MIDDGQHTPEHDEAQASDAERDEAAGVAELIREAAQLQPLRPSRDLWDGIAARIETPVIGGRDTGALQRSAWTRPLRLAAAAALLVAVTASATWQIARRTLPSAADTPALVADEVTASSSAPIVRLASTYDHEIAVLREILTLRELALDDETTRVLDENLRVIDDAIAAARAALDADPASALLTQRLTGAYDMKLDLLRRLATLTEIS
jgi:hypothetical protein